MKLSNTMKGALAIAAIAGPLGVAHAAEVELQTGFSISMSRYGMTWVNNSFEVEVENLGADKEVAIHQQLADGSWQDFPMYYSGTVGSNKEIWKIGHDLTGTGEFAVKYTVNGVTYWDNNNGSNYDLVGGYILGGDKTVVLSNHRLSDYNPGDNQADFYAQIVVKNTTPNKQVKLVYTTDSWATSTVLDASYSGPNVVLGYGSYMNPNSAGYEVWDVSADVPEDFDGEFFIEYVADGASSYDNNNNANYDVKFDGSYDSLHLRQSPSWQSGYPMFMINDNVWNTAISVAEGESKEFKLDVYNDWSLNFGDNNADGIADQGGANIQINEAGSYQLYFNDVTNEYWLHRYND